MNELKHHGIPGMKWGVRRYQNKDGTLTPAGKRREASLDRKMAKQAHKYNQLKSKKLTNKENQQEDIHKKKNTNKMTDDELRQKASRLELENRYLNAVKNYNNLNPKQVSKGKAFVSTIAKGIIVAGSVEAGKEIYKKLLTESISARMKK